MPGNRITAEQIIENLREVEVLLAQGKAISQVCISKLTPYWIEQPMESSLNKR